MTATDELRRMLDERGVEWKEEGHNKTKWSHDGIEYVAVNAWPRNGGFETRLILHANLTPEQAIEATLGRGECKNVSDPPEGFYCSSCGWGDFAEPSHLLTTAKFTDNDGGPNYCPNCGKPVKR